MFVIMAARNARAVSRIPYTEQLHRVLKGDAYIAYNKVITFLFILHCNCIFFSVCFFTNRKHEIFNRKTVNFIFVLLASWCGDIKGMTSLP